MAAFHWYYFSRKWYIIIFNGDKTPWSLTDCCFVILKLKFAEKSNNMVYLAPNEKKRKSKSIFM